MQKRIVMYSNRNEMDRGINRLTIEGWMVQSITALESRSYRVEFVRSSYEEENLQVNAQALAPNEPLSSFS